MTLERDYYVGDLCYVLNDDTWRKICQYMFPEDGGEAYGLFKLDDGRSVYIYRTAHGDGCYPDMDGNEYGVDSGTIGCMLADEVDEPDRLFLGNVHRMYPPICYTTTRGQLHFGHIKINTN